LEESLQSCFVVATSTSPSPSSDPQSAETAPASDGSSVNRRTPNRPLLLATSLQAVRSKQEPSAASAWLPHLSKLDTPRVRGDEMTACAGNARAPNARVLRRADYRIARNAGASKGDHESVKTDRAAGASSRRSRYCFAHKQQSRTARVGVPWLLIWNGSRSPADVGQPRPADCRNRSRPAVSDGPIRLVETAATTQSRRPGSGKWRRRSSFQLKRCMRGPGSALRKRTTAANLWTPPVREQMCRVCLAGDASRSSAKPN
jgi:hypothetical protein